MAKKFSIWGLHKIPPLLTCVHGNPLSIIPTLPTTLEKWSYDWTKWQILFRVQKGWYLFPRRKITFLNVENWICHLPRLIGAQMRDWKEKPAKISNRNMVFISLVLQGTDTKCFQSSDLSSVLFILSFEILFYFLPRGQALLISINMLAQIGLWTSHSVFVSQGTNSPITQFEPIC